MFSIGLDLGQRRDNTALVVIEKPEPRMPFLRPEDRELRVRMAERLPLGTPYPEVVEVMRHVESLAALQGQRCTLTVDATGLGKPVVEMLRRARLRSWITAVTITSGDRESRRPGDGGGLRFGADGYKQHDDLVIGLALSVWRARRA